MSPLRWPSMLCLVLCGWCAGDSVTARIQVHLDTLQQTIALLELLRQEIGFRQSDLETLRKKLIAIHSTVQIRTASGIGYFLEKKA